MPETPVTNGKPATLDSNTSIFDLFDIEQLEAEATGESAPVERPRTSPPSTPTSKPAIAKVETVSTPPAEPKPSKHSRHLLSTATDMGLSEALIERLEPHELSELIISALKRESAESKAASRVTPDQSKKPPVETVSTPVPETKAFPFDWGKDDDGGEITAQDIHPVLRKHLPEIVEKLKRLEQLEQTVGQLLATERSRGEARATSAADRVFAKFPQVFGTGAATEIDKKSPEFLRRRQCYLAAKELHESMPDTITPEAALERMAKALFGVETVSTPPVQTPPTPPTKPARGNMPPTDQEWDAGTVQRPTRRTGGDANGRAKAMNGLSERLREYYPETGSTDGGETSIDEFL